jgi:hypothetical protein
MSDLFVYGIAQDKSDQRAHVCVSAETVYVFRTRDGQAAIRHTRYDPVEVRAPDGTITAAGVLVPPADIPGIIAVPIPDGWLNYPSLAIEPFDSTSKKGDRAALIVYGLLKTDRFPLFLSASDMVSDHRLQIDGCDLRASVHIQVKCDYVGGEVSRGGSGFLFIQTAERNANKAY